MSEDQVTHTPTPWLSCTDDSDRPRVVEITTEDRIYRRMVSIAEVEIDFREPVEAEQRANAEFIVLAVNSHDALTARVAELEAENERLRELIECAALYLDAFEGDIMEIDPEVLTGIPLSPTNMAAGVRAAALKPEA